MAGYHKSTITQGKYGQISKIKEELEELEDAELQGNPILQLNELSDLIGAIEGYIESYFPWVSLEDVIQMAKLTKEAFEDGHRINKS